MRREQLAPRPDWRNRVERLGLTFHTIENEPYWNESAAYRFDPSEIQELESSTQALSDLCLQAVEEVLSRDWLDRLAIPAEAHTALRRAWELDPPSLYGRFDLAYDGSGPPKLLEFNADTPTSLLEAAVIQWHWLQDVKPSADQFNSIWEGLVAKWKELDAEGLLRTHRVHFGCLDHAEDLMTTAVLMDTAKEAGLAVVMLHMSEIGWDEDAREFVDTRHDAILTLFKLYPWEWVLDDKFGAYALESLSQMHWIEPIWKMILSNKGILAILWELFPDHPNLLPCYFEADSLLESYVRKPLLGREGANVSIVAPGQHIAVEGPYGAEGFVRQAYAPLPVFDGRHTLVGSWVIDWAPHGIGIRESNGPITGDLAQFVPHYFDG